MTTNLYVEVGSYLPNAWGLYDMLGNVREQTCDIFTSAQIDGGLFTTNNVDLVGFRDASSGLKYGRTGSLGADPVTGTKVTRYFVAGIDANSEGTMQSKNAGNEWSGFRLVVRPVDEEE